MKKRIRLTEGQLYGLIRQALNETDWKTYAEVEKFLDYARNNKANSYFIRPIALNVLSKKIGRKSAKRIVDNLYLNELNAYLYDMGIDVMREIEKMKEKFGTAKALSFAHKYGHKPDFIYPKTDFDPNAKSYMGLMKNQGVVGNDVTYDQDGNMWKMSERGYGGGYGGGICLTGKNNVGRADIFEPYDPSQNGPYWDYSAINKKGEETLHNLSQSEAGKDLYNYAADNYEYVKGKGWQLKQKNESLARRVTESIIRKLNENDVADIYHDDALSNIALTVENDEEIYGQMTWLKNALAKKINRGLVPDRNYLANCSTVRKIAQMAVRKNIKFYEEQWGERPPYLSNAQKQEIRNHIAALILDRLSDDGLI